MILNIENKIKILPFIMETDWKEIISIWSEEELEFRSSKFYYIKLKNGDDLILDKNLELPLLINGSYKKIKIEDLYNEYSLNLEYSNSEFKEDKKKINSNIFKNENKIELFKYKSSNGMSLKIKENKILSNLFEDFEFENIELESISIYSEETGIVIYDMIKKIILVNDYLILIPIEKKEKSNSFLELNKKELFDKLFMLEEGIKLISDDILKEDLLKISKSIK